MCARLVDLRARAAARRPNWAKAPHKGAQRAQQQASGAVDALRGGRARFVPQLAHLQCIARQLQRVVVARLCLRGVQPCARTPAQSGEIRACGVGGFRGVAVQGRMLTSHAAYLHRPSARAAQCRCRTCPPSQREQAQGARTAQAMITMKAAASRCTLAATPAVTALLVSGTRSARFQSRHTSSLHRRR